MDKQHVRLECLKLAAARSLDGQTIVANAEAFVKFVVSESSKEPQAGQPENGSKKPENAKILP